MRLKIQNEKLVTISLKKLNLLALFVCFKFWKLLGVLTSGWRDYRLTTIINQKLAYPGQKLSYQLLPNKKQGFLLKICRLMKGKGKWLLFKSSVSLQWCDSQSIKRFVRLEQEIKVP